MVLVLPPEILKLVAYHLQDNRLALHACLLVSHDWSKAAVEYLYKAEHMMSDFEFQSFSTMAAFSAPGWSIEGLNLGSHYRSGPNPGSPTIVHSRPLMAQSPQLLSLASASIGMMTSDFFLRSEIITQLLLKRTLDASLLHDEECSYDYVSYLNKISCPWFVGLIQDWNTFCNDWRGHQARLHPVPIDPTADHSTEPSIARQEHSFNRLVRKVARRCMSVDEFRSSCMVQPETLVYAIRQFKDLSWIDLKDSQDLTDAVFEALASTVRSLSYIRLPGSKMKKVSIHAVAHMLLSLQHNSLCQFKVIHGTTLFATDEILKAIGERHGGSMRRLTLAICDLEHSGLEQYGLLCTQLASLNLEYSSGVTNDMLIPILDSCRHLKKLDLTETECSLPTVQAISTAFESTEPQAGRFAYMKRLVLNNIDAPFTTNLFLPLADACPYLEELHMNSILADTFQDFVPFIAKMKTLKDLDIGNVFPEFNDANLVQLVDALPDLRWLSIANTQITDVSLKYLGKMARHLCDLCILGCDQVTKAGLLDFLDNGIHKTGFKRLDITYCRLDESSVAEIRDRARWLALEQGLTEGVEVEGDDQFADSLAEEEPEDSSADEADEAGEDVEGDDEEEVPMDGHIEDATLETSLLDTEPSGLGGVGGHEETDPFDQAGNEDESNGYDENESEDEEEDLSDFSNNLSEFEEELNEGSGEGLWGSYRGLALQLEHGLGDLNLNH